MNQVRFREIAFGCWRLRLYRHKLSNFSAGAVCPMPRSIRISHHLNWRRNMFETLEMRRLMSGTTFSDGVIASMGTGSTLLINAPVGGSNLTVLEMNGNLSVQ